jgi:hypothetical protein
MAFTAASMKKGHGPASRRKAVATRKRNQLAKARAAKAAGKTTVFNLADLPSDKPTPTTKKKGTRNQPTDRIQLARELIALIDHILK